jgi:hypothetical protein
MGIDDESSSPRFCVSEVADGVTCLVLLGVRLFREPDAGNPPVRFDEREQETGPSQTGLRGGGESRITHPPGDYSYCACSRLYFLSEFRRLHSLAASSKQLLVTSPFDHCSQGKGPQKLEQNTYACYSASQLFSFAKKPIILMSLQKFLDNAGK